MQSFSIVAGNSIKKDLRKLPSDVFERVADMFERLSLDPFGIGAQRMTDVVGCKVRVGNYQIRFDVDIKSREVTILRVRHRNEVYKKR